MIKHVVKLALTYRAEFIPYRHRLSRVEGVRSNGAVEIREVTPEDAPVSHRILGKDGQPQAEVRYFEGEYWWFLNDMGHPTSVEKFKSLAQDLDWEVLNAFDVQFYHWKHASEDALLATKARVLGSGFGEQWKKAQSGASKVLFCDSAVMVEAGPPNYYGLREDSAISFVVGPSSLERIEGDLLFGPEIRTRNWATQQGLAFEAQEFDREKPLLGKRADSVDFLFRIEDVMRVPVPQIAPWKCARALATQLWGAKRMPFAERLPTVANAEQDECPEDPAVHRAVLEEFAALDLEQLTPFCETPGDAREILRRLDLVGHPALSDEDEAALDRIEDCAKARFEHAECERRSAP